MLGRSAQCDAVMTGRLAVRQPWCFAEARALEEAGGQDAGAKAAVTASVNIEETGLRFLELLARYQPPEFHVSRARRFFSYFCDNLKWAHYVKTLLNRETGLTGIERVWKEYFSGNPEETTLRERQAAGAQAFQ
jgi:tRNA-dihydrouridine synthase